MNTEMRTERHIGRVFLTLMVSAQILAVQAHAEALLLPEEPLPEAPVVLENRDLSTGQETFWDCSNIDVKDCVIERADYVFMHCENIVLENVKLQGNYGFQYAKNVVIKNSVLNS